MIENYFIHKDFTTFSPITLTLENHFVLNFHICVTQLYIFVMQDIFSLSIMALRSIQIIACINNLFFFYYCLLFHGMNLGFPGGAICREPTCHCRRHERCGFDPWVREMPWRRAWNPFQYFCLENPMDSRSWQGMVHRVIKSQTWLKRLSMHVYTI